MNLFRFKLSYACSSRHGKQDENCNLVRVKVSRTKCIINLPRWFHFKVGNVLKVDNFIGS